MKEIPEIQPAVIPQWQKDMIDERLAEYYKNPEIALDWDDVMKEIEAEDNDMDIKDKHIKSYENDPLLEKKNKESREFLQKHGFPEELVRK